MKRNEITSYLLGLLALTLTPGCPPTVVDGNTNDNEPTAATAEIGYTDEAGLNYAVVGNGEVMPLFTSGQGGSHMFAVLRASGFPVDENGNAEINVDQIITLDPGGRILHDFSSQVTFSSLEVGQLTTLERIVVFEASPDDVNGQSINIAFLLTSVADPTVSAVIQQSLLMQLE